MRRCNVTSAATELEQEQLRWKRVAIAGMGGVGGFHLTTLARLGISKFNIADLDTFELANFNRQAGAVVARSAAQGWTLADMARDINPVATFEIRGRGRTGQHRRLLPGRGPLRRRTRCLRIPSARAGASYRAEHQIPATSVAPLGMSAALLNFLPGRMTFEQGLSTGRMFGCGEGDLFLVGSRRRYYTATTWLIRHGSVWPKAGAHRQGCRRMLCAGVASAEALKILIGRGKVWAAPHAIQFDGFRNQLAHTWRPGGNSHPLNRLAIAIAKRQLGIVSAWKRNPCSRLMAAAGV